jgi:hypothetical protein
VTLLDGKREHRIAIPTDWPRDVGLILAAPGRSPRVVYSTEGPSSVPGVQAAFEYFGSARWRCKPR